MDNIARTFEELELMPIRRMTAKGIRMYCHTTKFRSVAEKNAFINGFHEGMLYLLEKEKES